MGGNAVMNVVLLVLYQLIATGALIIGAPFLALRAIRHLREMTERLGGTPRTGPVPVRPLWMHAASLGELESLRAVWESPDRGPAGPLLLTVLSVSARRRAPEVTPAGTRVCFAPLDLWCAVIPFLRRQRPRALVLVETELWPMTLAACFARRIPVVLVSGRLSARKWRRTRLLRPLLRPLLRRLDGCAAQSDDDAARLSALGAVDIEIAGNLKYRLAEDPQPSDSADGRFVFVAGSVRLGEESVLEVARLPGVLAVIAPRHLREREQWVSACRAGGIRCVSRRSAELQVPSAESLRAPAGRASLRAALESVLAGGTGGEPAILLVDLHGELGTWYAVADAAFVGGTLVPIGGHNLFEPARCGVPVSFGPHTGGVEDAAQSLLRSGGGARVRDGAELTSWVARLRDDRDAARQASLGAAAAARSLAGGVERTLDFLQQFEWYAPSSDGARTERR
jgi:3-deoxy-D-manno-octulosonic-acid transferase